MRICSFISVTLLVVCKQAVNGQIGETTFKGLVCQQCTVWCGPDQPRTLVSRVGEAGSRRPRGEIGPAGPRDPAGVVNMTKIEEIIEKKIQAGIL